MTTEKITRYTIVSFLFKALSFLMGSAAGYMFLWVCSEFKDIPFTTELMIRFGILIGFLFFAILAVLFNFISKDYKLKAKKIAKRIEEKARFDVEMSYAIDSVKKQRHAIAKQNIDIEF